MSREIVGRERGGRVAFDRGRPIAWTRRLTVRRRWVAVCIGLNWCLQAIGQQASTETSGSGSSEALREVVVTAEKYSERLQDVPMAVTALSGEALERTQSFRFEDYVGNVPGLTLVANNSIGSQLVIRGITSGVNAVNAGVATYIDETPYTLVGPVGNYGFAPNLDTFDMQRIEVLKGPQGTLYGASALAGLLKFVTNAPDPSGFAAKVETGVSSVDNGGIGSEVHGMVNIPLGSEAALRMVGYDNYYPGFINDPSRGLSDINSSRYAGGRASLLYQPAENLSARITALYQERSWNDWNTVDLSPGTLRPLYGKLDHETLIGQPGDTTTELYNLTVNWGLGFGRLLSTTSYAKFRTKFTDDDSTSLGPVLSGAFGAPYGLDLPEAQPSHDITQELRLSSAGEPSLQWQVGGYFTNEEAAEDQSLYLINATTKTVLYNFPVDIGSVGVPVSYREYAGFANVDYHFSPTVDMSLGGRYSENHQTFHETATGVLLGNVDFETPSSEGVFTYSGDVRWHVAPQSMLYARIASGFVPGGPNDVLLTSANEPRSYSSSTTVNYEIGLKSDFLDKRVTVDASAFYIDWRKIQLTAVIAGEGSIVNGGSAKSQGVEWAVEVAPITGLILGFNGAYTDAYLTEPTPASVNGQVGDRLPAVPLWATSANARYERPLAGQYSTFAGVNWQFSGKRFAQFEAVGPRQLMPSFDLVDLQAGIETQRWSLALYVKNVGNKFAISYLQDETLTGGLGAQSATIYTPRTVGATLSAKF